MRTTVEVHPEETRDAASLTPDQIVSELDRYIIAQDEAKRAVAIALRNRWRRLRIDREMQDEVTPKNILMIGPTGVGKTEISRRLAKLANAPFVKVEASKFTEVGYVGRDVDSIVRDLVDLAYHMVKEEERQKVLERAAEQADEQLLDLLLPRSHPAGSDEHEAPPGVPTPESSSLHNTREKLRSYLHAGKLDERTVELEVERAAPTQMQVLNAQGLGEIEGQMKEMFSNLLPKQHEVRKVTVAEARKILIEEAQEELVDQEEIGERACRKAEQTGIIFIDEIDKIATTGSGTRSGPDVSREGVQRDLLPLVEGSTVNTKYGPVRTDHMLFIASGAFHTTKPSDLMPEFQGRFPIRVELKSLNAEHFFRILTEPRNALTKQYAALLHTEGVTIEFTRDALEEVAELTEVVNSQTENIGARRLHTLLERVLDEISFTAHQRQGETVVIDRAYVKERLGSIVKDTDLSRFIL